MVQHRFKDKVALVTGSTQGLGEAVARRLSQEGASGMVICGRHRERGEAVAASIPGAVFVQVELADPEAVANLIEITDQTFGRVDTLVNAAALSLRGTIVDTTVELFDRLMAVNVRAPFMLMQGAIRLMRRDGIEGTIVNVGSVASHGSETFLTAYATTKGALKTLTKNVAYSVMRDRIRVNIINPGWMDTPGEDVIQRHFHSEGKPWLEQAEASRPFGRLIKPDELATAIAFLASSDSGLMTGATIDFDQSVVGGGPAAFPTEAETPR